jgi:alpha-tubulin suppressor-like RCC1 family protein
LITWGWNEHGLCGNGNEDNILIPHQVTALTDHVIKMLGCGAGHSFAMINDTWYEIKWNNTCTLSVRNILDAQKVQISTIFYLPV